MSIIASGRRVVTASDDRTARIWDVLLGTGSSQDAELLADAAEIAGGYRVNEFGSIVPIDDTLTLRAALWKRLNGLPDTPRSVAWFLRRFLPQPVNVGDGGRGSEGRRGGVRRAHYRTERGFGGR